MKKINIAILGGDMRHNYLACEFSKLDFNVYTFAQENGMLNFETLQDDTDVDVYIFPMPISADGIHLNTAISDKSYKLQDIISNLHKHSVVLGGNITNSVRNMFIDHNIYAIDYLKREDLAILNAIPTAEGALQIAFEEMPITLHNSNSLVLGNGRIGKVLAKKLHALGSNTTIGARKALDFADIYSNGIKSCELSKIDYSNYDVIFNTIPYKILDKDALKSVRSDALIIDLASKPGGVDFLTAQNLSLKVIWALSLPGKVAPITSAKFIFETVNNILQELEVI